MLALDLFAGTGGASAAMRARGWGVVTVDADPSFGCTVTADLDRWSYAGPRPDLVWASPPCDEFSRTGMPWFRDPPTPSLALVLAALRVIDECQPHWWIIENVRGSIRWIRPLLGPVVQQVGSAFLWGRFPALPRLRLRGHKERLSGRDRVKRAAIPYALSHAVAVACESGRGLLSDVW